MKKRSIYFTALLLCFGLSAAAYELKPYVDSLPSLVKLDEQYGTDSLQRYDIYLPANRSAKTTPLLILIHGGGWQEGDKTNYNNQITGLRVIFPHYAIATINYRLYANGINKFPTQENDVKAGIGYILGHAKNYDVSTTFALMGNSAGSHLALLYAYKYDKSPRPQAVIDFVGPTDMTRMYKDAAADDIRTIITKLIGDPGKDAAAFDQSSPIKYVTPASPPTLMFYGDADNLVPHSQGEMLRDALEKNKVKHVLKVYAGQGHDLSGAGEDLLTHMVDFLKKYLP